MFSSPKTRKLGQKFCYTEQFLVSVNYLHIEVQGGLVSDDTNLGIKTHMKEMKAKEQFK